MFSRRQTTRSTRHPDEGRDLSKVMLGTQVNITLQSVQLECQNWRARMEPHLGQVPAFAGMTTYHVPWGQSTGKGC